MKPYPFFFILFSACASEEAVKVYNSTPTVTITSHSDGEVLQDGYDVLFQAQVQDDNHEASSLKVSWSSNVRTLCPEEVPTADGVSQCQVSLESGENSIRVQVTDPEGSAAIDELSFELQQTFAPTIEVISPVTQGLYYSDTLILFSAQIQDVEDDPSELIYSWESSLDGVLPTTASPNEDGLLEEYLYLSEGTHALTLTVTDLSGKSTEKSLSFSVGGTNTLPDCGITSPLSGDTFVLGEDILFEATANDNEVEIDALDIMWSSDKDGDLGRGNITSSGIVSLSYSDLSANSHNIQLTVKDEQNSTCYDSIVISVGTPPELEITAPTNGTVFKVGEMIQFTGTVDDDEILPSQVALSWVSNIDGEFSTQGSNSTGGIEVFTPGLSAGQHIITVTASDSSGLSDSENLSIVVNDVPSQPVLSLSPSQAYTSDTLAATASGSSDSEGQNISYAYEWYKDNAVTTNVGPTIPSSATSKGESWTVRVTPNDGYHDGPYTEASVVIENSTPEIDSLNIDSSLATTSQTLTCTGISSDADGDPLTEVYEWTNSSTQMVIGSSSTLTLSPLSVSPGDYIGCTYSVDDGSIGASQSSVISVVNTDPSIDSMSIVPSTPYIGDTLSCIGTITEADLEATTETYLWENQTTGVILSTNSSLMIDSNNVSPNDSIACTLTVADSSGGTVSATEVVSVGNLSPSIDALSFDASSVAIGDTLTCLSSESDPEGEIPSVTYEWSNDTTGISIGSGASLTLTPSMATGLDQITCTAEAVDSYGATDTESISIFVDETVPQFTTEASISPTTGLTTGSTLSCTGVASDPDGTSVQLTYAWNVGTTTIGTSQSITLSPNDVNPTDIVECVITATDSSGEQATSNASVMIGNSFPIISSVTLSPSTGIDTSSTLTCLAAVTDPDLETLTTSYSWLNGTNTIGTGDSITLDPSIVQPADSITCEAKVTDGYGASTSDTASAVVSNTTPTIASLSISPTTSYNDSLLTCSVTASDADNETLTESYTWTNVTTGTSLGSSATLTLDSSLASRNDEISCSVTVTDPSGDSASDSVSRTLTNRAPSAPTVVLDPSPAYLDSTLTCMASGSTDADNDTIGYSYAWSINSASTPETSSTLSAGFIAGDSVVCTVTPNDGLIDGSSTSETIVISNTPPVVSSVSISPDPAYTNDQLSASAVFSDLDGDSLTLAYTWEVDGTEVQSGASTTLASSFFSKGETVSVSVVANDGANSSVAETTSILISNSIPTAPTLSIYPAVPEEQTDDLLCSIDTSSSDDDADSVTYTFSWTVDGVQYSSASSTATTSTVQAAETNGGEEWECTVTPNDGEEDGPTASVSVTIDSSCLTIVVEGISGDLEYCVDCVPGDYSCQAESICNQITGETCVHQQYDCHNGNRGSWYPPSHGGSSNFNFAYDYDFGGGGTSGGYGNICDCINVSSSYGIASNHTYCGTGHWWRQ